MKWTLFYLKKPCSKRKPFSPLNTFFLKCSTLEPLSPPSWSLSLSPQTNTLVLMVAADSNPDDFFRARLESRAKRRTVRPWMWHHFRLIQPRIGQSPCPVFAKYLPVAVLSSSSSSLSDARKGTVARSSSSALMRPTMLSPWILQSIPELRHCLMAISMYLWYCGE